MKQEDHLFYLAPLRGVTVKSFRNLHATWFRPAPRAVAPFIPTIAGPKVKSKVLQDIDPQQPQIKGLIPQVIGKDPEHLRVMLQAFLDLGYRTADLNAGCPYPFIIKKGRGAGLMRQADLLARMLEVGCATMPEGFSLKIRLGIDDGNLLTNLMGLINEFPLREVTIHARTARQMYEGQVDLRAFAQAAATCHHPVVYNGDILNCASWSQLRTQLPTIRRWMIGRAVARNPFIFEELYNDHSRGAPQARLMGFLEDYLQQNIVELHGPAAVLGRMKELWSYLHHYFAKGAHLWREIRICRSIAEYQKVLEELEVEG